MVIAPGKGGISAFVILTDDEHLPVNLNSVKVLVMRRGKSTNNELKIVKAFGELADPSLLKPEEPSVCNYDGQVPPIHQHADQTWWFYEVTYTFEQGPFPTEAEANLALTRYCEEYQDSLEKSLGEKSE